jgi:hypothetical protein
MSANRARRQAWQRRVRSAFERERLQRLCDEWPLLNDFLTEAKRQNWPVEMHNNGALYVWQYRVKLHCLNKDWLFGGYYPRRCGRGYLRLYATNHGKTPVLRAIWSADGWTIAYDPGGAPTLRYIDPMLLQHNKPWWPTEAEIAAAASAATALVLFNPRTRTADRHVLRRRWERAA